MLVAALASVRESAAFHHRHPRYHPGMGGRGMRPNRPPPHGRRDVSSRDIHRWLRRFPDHVSTTHRWRMCRWPHSLRPGGGGSLLRPHPFSRPLRTMRKCLRLRNRVPVVQVSTTCMQRRPDLQNLACDRHGALGRPPHGALGRYPPTHLLLLRAGPWGLRRRWHVGFCRPNARRRFHGTHAGLG